MGREPKLPVRFGPFSLLRLLGAGGMGNAYFAKHPEWPALLVVKRMHRHFLDDPDSFKRFVHEAQIATYVRHPNVAPLVAVGTVGKEPFFATEYVFGLPVVELVERIEDRKTTRIPLHLGLYLAIDLLKGLEAIHDAVNTETGERLGLIHRDLANRNVLVGFDGCLRIIDLGLGKSILSDWQTATNVVAGSPDYMPPEQALGQRVDRRADVYATAVCVWELLVGRKRIREKKVAQRIARAIEARAEPLLCYVPEATHDLEAALQQAMDPVTESRTASAAILREALENELLRTGVEVHRRDVVNWLDISCATLKATRGRELEEAEALAERELRESPVHTEILAAHPVVFVPTSQRTRRPDSHLAAIPKMGLGETLRAFFSRFPREFSREFGRALFELSAAFSALEPKLRVGLLSLGLATIAVLALGVFIQTPERSTLPAVSSAPDPNENSARKDSDRDPLRFDQKTQAIEESSLPEGAPAVPVRQAAPREEGIAQEAAVEEMRIEDPSSTPTPDRPSIEKLRTRKRALARRLKELRRLRFDVRYQSKLNRLGRMLTSARSGGQLDEVEARIARLEKRR